MWDTLLPLLVEAGQAVVPWVASLLLGVLTKYAFSKIKNDFARGTVTRAYEEVNDAALEVWQTYVKEIKKGREDGKLTDEEKKVAHDKAVAVLKSNLGPKGLAALGRVVGASGVSSWLDNKVESSVAKLSVARKAISEPPKS